MLIYVVMEQVRIERQGFTLVELIAIIAVLGILAAIALPKFFNLSGYQNRAAYDEIAGVLRYAQKLAVGSGCDVRVVFTTGNNYALQQHETCTSGAFTTISDHPVNSGTISGAALSSDPASFIFDPMGRSSSPATITVGGKTIRVVEETGAVVAQ